MSKCRPCLLVMNPLFKVQLKTFHAITSCSFGITKAHVPNSLFLFLLCETLWKDTVKRNELKRLCYEVFWIKLLFGCGY